MKKCILITLILLSLYFAKPLLAEWVRLKSVDELWLSGVKVYVIYDEVEKVNCYVVISDQLTINQNRSNSIDCLPIKDRP